MEEQIYLNGVYIPRANANISIMDRGFLFGDGVYELIPLYRKKIFLLDKHLKRLKNSLNLIGMKDNDFNINDIENIITTLVKKNKYENYFFYIHITRGIQNTRQHIYPENLKPTVLVMGENCSIFNKHYKICNAHLKIGKHIVVCYVIFLYFYYSVFVIR